MGITINQKLTFGNMKKKLTLVATAFVFLSSSAFLSSCGNHEEAESTEAQAESPEGHEHATASYACPMKCEGEKTYSEAGKCGSCGMALEEVGHSHEQGEHSH